MIKNITERLYLESPEEPLYHYTTFAGLMGIVESRAIWASDIRYMNDSAEIKHTADLLGAEIAARLASRDANQKLLGQFTDWIANRMTNGHMLFGASFRSNGNLLSQWRGYSVLGKGVSIGFDPQYLVACARRQACRLGKCIYDLGEQKALIKQIVDEIQTLAQIHGENTDQSRRPPNQSYYDIFELMESDLLRIAAILKHPSFREEEEWRIVSPVLSDYVESPVQFREGTSMLVPYLEIKLTPDPRHPSSLSMSS